MSTEANKIILGATPMTQPPIKPDRGQAPLTPLWVKIFIAIFVIVVVVVIAVHLAGVDFGHMQHMR